MSPAGVTNLSHIPFPDVLTQKMWVGSHSQTFLMSSIYFPSVADLCEPGGWHWLYKVLTNSSQKHFDYGSQIPYSRSPKSCQG